MEEFINATIDGKNIVAPQNLSIIQALWYANSPQVKNIGCLSGACGSCRVFVRRPGTAEVTTALACKLVIEEGLQVNFLPSPGVNQKKYNLDSIKSYDQVDEVFQKVFSEAKDCRHCGGCNTACPVDIDVEQGVILAAQGQYAQAGDLFMSCVQCNLCETACPEFIDPNYLGLFCRRVSAHFAERPSNLVTKLIQIRKGELRVKF